MQLELLLGVLAWRVVQEQHLGQAWELHHYEHHYDDDDEVHVVGHFEAVIAELQPLGEIAEGDAVAGLFGLYDDSSDS